MKLPRYWWISPPAVLAWFLAACALLSGLVIGATKLVRYLADLVSTFF